MSAHPDLPLSADREREIVSSECCCPAFTSVDLNVTFQARKQAHVRAQRVVLVGGEPVWSPAPC